VLKITQYFAGRVSLKFMFAFIGLLQQTRNVLAGERNIVLTGLALAYALPMVSLLTGLVTTAAETEQEMVSVERILHFNPASLASKPLEQICNSGVILARSSADCLAMLQPTEMASIYSWLQSIVIEHVLYD
jgi:hypothetical protein